MPQWRAVGLRVFQGWAGRAMGCEVKVEVEYLGGTDHSGIGTRKDEGEETLVQHVCDGCSTPMSAIGRDTI